MEGTGYDTESTLGGDIENPMPAPALTATVNTRLRPTACARLHVMPVEEMLETLQANKNGEDGGPNVTFVLPVSPNPNPLNETFKPDTTSPAKTMRLLARGPEGELNDPVVIKGVEKENKLAAPDRSTNVTVTGKLAPIPFKTVH